MQEPRMETETKEPFKVSILTPYLSETLEDFFQGSNPKEFIEQVTLYDYNPDNLSKIPKLLTRNKRAVLLDSPVYFPGSKRTLFDTVDADLVIAGSARAGEKEVRMLKDIGLIVARFSIFYGKPSEYTGSLPEEAGYSLDLPKDAAIVEKMLKDDYFLNSITEGDEGKIKDSIRILNRKLRQPILITPYLSKNLMER